MPHPTPGFEYRWLKIVRSSIQREQHPDWYDPAFLTPLQVEDLNVMLAEASREAKVMSHRELIARATRDGSHVLAVFDVKETADLEQAPLVGYAMMIEIHSLTLQYAHHIETLVRARHRDLGIGSSLRQQMQELADSLNLPLHPSHRTDKADLDVAERI